MSHNQNWVCPKSHGKTSTGRLAAPSLCWDCPLPASIYPGLIAALPGCQADGINEKPHPFFGFQPKLAQETNGSVAKCKPPHPAANKILISCSWRQSLGKTLLWNLRQALNLQDLGQFRLLRVGIVEVVLHLSNVEHPPVFSQTYP